jgi:hypothetical protein
MIHLQSMLEKGITTTLIMVLYAIMMPIVTPVVGALIGVVGLINPTTTTNKRLIKA